MATKMKVLPENDSKYIYKTLLDLGVSRLRLSQLLDCSNVVFNWSSGYRRVPKAFRRSILMLRFINNKGLMNEFLQFVKHQEKQNGN